MMDAYTLHLLGMAVEACGDRPGTFATDQVADRWIASLSDSALRGFGDGDTLADALAALLADLGAEVPERPTAERRDEVWQHLNEAEHNGEFLDGMRDYPDRLAVLALLEEGS